MTEVMGSLRTGRLFHDALALFTILVLNLDPFVSGCKTFIERGVRLPLKNFLDERVVRVAAGHAKWSVELVRALEFYAGNFLYLADEGIDGDEFAGTKIDGRGDEVVAMRDHVDALHAVVDEHEAAGLLAVAPDVDAEILFINGF